MWWANNRCSNKWNKNSAVPIYHFLKFGQLYNNFLSIIASKLCIILNPGLPQVKPGFGFEVVNPGLGYPGSGFGLSSCFSALFVANSLRKNKT